MWPTGTAGRLPVGGKHRESPCQVSLVVEHIENMREVSMTTTEIGEISIACGACGSDEVKYDPSLGDGSDVRCARCDAHLGTVGGFRTLASAEASERMPEIAAAVKKALGL